MNNITRKKLENTLKDLDGIERGISDICDAEQEKMDNYPESLQDSEAYEAMENAVDNLSQVPDLIDEIKDLVNEAIG